MGHNRAKELPAQRTDKGLGGQLIERTTRSANTTGASSAASPREPVSKQLEAAALSIVRRLVEQMHCRSSSFLLILISSLSCTVTSCATVLVVSYCCRSRQSAPTHVTTQKPSLTSSDIVPPTRSTSRRTTASRRERVSFRCVQSEAGGFRIVALVNDQLLPLVLTEIDPAPTSHLPVISSSSDFHEHAMPESCPGSSTQPCFRKPQENLLNPCTGQGGSCMYTTTFL